MAHLERQRIVDNPRIDEGNSRCLGQEVVVDGAGVSEVEIGAEGDPKERKKTADV